MSATLWQRRQVSRLSKVALCAPEPPAPENAGILISSFLLGVVVFFGSGASALAQQNVSGPPPQVRSLNAVAADLKRRLASNRYTNIILNVKGSQIVGVALRDGRTVQVVVDEKGRLHTGADAARFRKER